MFFEDGASQVGAKISPKIDFGGLWTPLCKTVVCFWLDVVLKSAFLMFEGIRRAHEDCNFWDLGLTRETLAKAKVPS